VFCFRGEIRSDLDLTIPAIAHWRLARLPRCLSAEELDRVMSACGGDALGRLRGCAILLLLALGLRSGDVAQLRFADIDCQGGTF
jgi:integrase